LIAAQHKQDGRTRILSAARHLFGSRGFHLTAMSELASEAQVSVGQIYRLFKNKYDIILAIVGDDHAEWLAQLERIRSDVRDGRISPAKAFEELARQELAADGETLTLEILAEAGRSPEVAAKIAEFCVEFRPILRDLACLANPRLQQRDLEAATEVLQACLFGLSGRMFAGCDVHIDIAAAETARLFMAMLDNAVS
jgi:TetR/AcrR family transcriptional regulator, repressor for uid operon